MQIREQSNLCMCDSDVSILQHLIQGLKAYMQCYTGTVGTWYAHLMSL